MSEHSDMYRNDLYIRLFGKHNMKTHEMDEFIKFHKHHVHTRDGDIEIQYDPKLIHKYSDAMTSQHIMHNAIKTGNLALVKYVYSKLGKKCFEELFQVPNYSITSPFYYAVASNSEIVKFMLSIGLNISWDSHKNTYSKLTGLLIVERVIYKKDQNFINYIVHELNREGIRYGLESQHPKHYEIPHRQIKLSDLEGKNVYEYLFTGKI